METLLNGYLGYNTIANLTKNNNNDNNNDNDNDNDNDNIFLKH